MAVMAVLLLFTIGGALAAADEVEEPTATFLPSDVDSAEDLAPLIAGSEPVGLDAETDPSAAEALPHTDLNRVEAEELLEGVFGEEAVEGPAEFFNELEIEAFRSDHVAVVAPPEPGGEAGLLSSTLPLRTADESGEEAPVDLGLEARGGSLEPANSLVQVQIPTQLSEGISLPAAEVTVELAGGEVDRGASELGEASAFYPNVATDTDLVVAAVPTGFETYTHLRSPQAPTRQRFHLDVPAGAELKETDSGGAEVMRPDGSVALSISTPSAIDAEGSDVPVEIEVEGSSVLLSADPGVDVAYPILVDPVFDTYNFTTATSPGTAGKDWVATPNTQGFGTSWGSPYYGMNARALVGPTTAGSNAWFNYYVPRYWADTQASLPTPTTYIRNMKLWGVAFMMPDEVGVATQYRAAYPSMQLGLWSETMKQFVAYGQRFGHEGQWTDGSYVFDMVNPNENTDVKNGGFGIGTWAPYNTVGRFVNVQQASVELTDQDSPGFGSISNPSGWMNATATGNIGYVVGDPGLGVHSFKVKQPKAEGGSQTITTSNNCVGNSQSYCPRKAETATRQITYSPQTMAQGENFIEVTAADPVNHVSPPAVARIKVDHSAPTISLSGNLTEQGLVGTNLSEYTLSYAAKDGDDAAAAALTPAGSAGKGEGQLERPMGVATAPDGSVYVVDRLNNRVVKYDKEGKFALQFGSPGSADGQFNDPRGIDVAPDGTVWVTDLGNDRIQAFSPSGTFLRKAKFSDPAAEPYAIASGPGGVLWVTDIGLHRLCKLTENPITSLLNTTGNSSTSLSSPTGVATDKFGNVWVADGGLGKVLEFDASGKLVFQFGTPGSGDGQIDGIVGIDVSPAGNIAITERNNGRVQIFKPDGSYLRKFGTTGSGSNQFSEAAGLSFGPDNTLVVADAGNKRIARWSHADQDPQSGVAKVEVKIDGATAHTKAPGCTTKNCQLSGSWALDADDYSGGAHKVEVIATDAVGIQATKTLDIETHGDGTNPTVALSGTMTQQASLGTTRPSYKLKAVATDPGPAAETKSGVAATTIKVDGTLVDSSSPGCPAGGCSITREWTLNSNSYSVGPHTVEVKATDAAGRSTTKTLIIDIARDNTAPEYALSDFYTAPSGWLEQENYEYTVFAQDPNGYGVTSIQLKIDGEVVDSFAQSCPAGSCTGYLGFGKWLDMEDYAGGAHPAELIATDGAGNTRKRSWTINIDPEGHISVGEAEDTLEALDATSSVNTVGLPASEVAYEGTAEDLTLHPVGDLLVAQGSVAPTAMSSDVPGELEVEIPTPTPDIACPNWAAEEGEEPIAEEERLAICEEPAAITLETDLLTPVSVTPITGIAGTDQSITPNSAAAVAGNVAPNVDLVTRPLFDGAMSFAAIRDASAIESFSWRVRLDEDQTLTLKNSKLVEVAYPGGYVAFTISAIPAHDAVGTTVPTRLSVVDDVLTLHVEHRTASFIYPVVGGAGWEGGFRTHEIVMPPSTEGEAGEGEIGEGEFSDEGRYREVTFGPPQAVTGPVPLKANSAKSKKRRYNFHDCRFDVAGGVQEPPGGSGGGNGIVRREKAIKKCHGESQNGPNGEYFTLAWAVSIHGTYEFDSENRFTWINKWPDCDKWGPDEPKKLGCRPESGGTGDLNFPNLDLLGFFRFAPGTHGIGEGAGNPVCFQLNGVLPSRWVHQEGGNSVLEETFHSYREWADPDEPCDWQDLNKIQ